MIQLWPIPVKGRAIRETTGRPATVVARGGLGTGVGGDPPPLLRRASDRGVLECVAKGVSADLLGRPHDSKGLPLRRGHDSARSSSQPTWSRRSANSHAPSVFASVSRKRSCAPSESLSARRVCCESGL